jgi:thymidylate kinase
MQGDAEALAAVGTVLRRHDRVRANVIRTLDRIVARTPWTTARAGARGLVVAVLGPDGAGKSTLVSGLRHSLALTTRSYYLGVLKTTDVTRRLRRVMPGLMLVVRLVKFRTICARARRAARRGEVVLFDRYSYDAFLPVTQQGVRGPVSAWLILRACPPPDMTLVLDVPAEVMFARKGELGEARLADFRMRYLAMHSRVPGLRVLDASRHAAEVEKAATALIWRELAGARTGVA